MKIKKGLEQFEKETAILAVAGERRAKFYLASKGEIGLAAEIEELAPKYEDNEGFFGGKKGGIASRTGRPSTEVDREYLRKKFAAAFAKEAAAIDKKSKASLICIFAPKEVLNILGASLPAALSRKVKVLVGGNHLAAAPFALLEKISKAKKGGREEKVELNPKARKLLSKK